MALHPEPANFTGLLDIFKYANTVSDGVFGIGIAITLYIVVFGYLHLKGEQPLDCAVVAGFFTSVVSIFLFIAGLITGWHLFMAIMMCILPAVGTYINKTG